MATLTKFYCLTEDLAEKVHNLASDTLKVMLTNTAPALTNTVPADITEIAAGFGYTAGGNTLTVTASSQTSGVYKLVASDSTFTAAGGSIGPFRYAVVYNSTATKLIGYVDYGGAITITTGNSFIIDLDQVGGLLTIT